jgi:hypothetical protein
MLLRFGDRNRHNQADETWHIFVIKQLPTNVFVIIYGFFPVFILCFFNGTAIEEKHHASARRV